jgi:hypothetical protein
MADIDRGHDHRRRVLISLSTSRTGDKPDERIFVKPLFKNIDCMKVSVHSRQQIMFNI